MLIPERSNTTSNSCWHSVLTPFHIAVGTMSNTTSNSLWHKGMPLPPKKGRIFFIGWRKKEKRRKEKGEVRELDSTQIDATPSREP